MMPVWSMLVALAVGLLLWAVSVTVWWAVWTLVIE